MPEVKLCIAFTRDPGDGAGDSSCGAAGSLTSEARLGCGAAGSLPSEARLGRRGSSSLPSEARLGREGPSQARRQEREPIPLVALTEALASPVERRTLWRQPYIEIIYLYIIITYHYHYLLFLLFLFLL